MAAVLQHLGRKFRQHPFRRRLIVYVTGSLAKAAATILKRDGVSMSIIQDDSTGAIVLHLVSINHTPRLSSSLSLSRAGIESSDPL